MSKAKPTDHVLSGPIEQARGVIGRYPSEKERFVFEFGSVKSRGIHMVGVRRPLRVQFFAEGEEVLDVVLSPWTGHASAECDRVIESRPEAFSDHPRHETASDDAD